MTYNPNIPAANDLLSVSQGDIQTNFSQANTVVAVDHYEFDNATAANRGKHKSVVLPEDAAVATAADEGALYTKDDGTRPALYYRQESNGTEIKFTGIDPLRATNGYTFLQGNLLMQWGKVAAPGNSGTVNFPTAFSAAPYSIQVSLERDSGNQSVTVDDAPAPTANAFQYLSSSSGSAFMYWIAIGPA